MSEKLKRVLIPIVITVAVAGLAYGGGRLQGHMRTTQVQEQADQTAADLEGQLQQVRGELTACTQRADQLEARRRLHMAVEELNALNFGYAQRHLKAAGNILAEAAPGDPKMEAMAKELEEMQIAPSGQLEQQRQQVRHVIERFDAAIPPAQR
jgi:hypothetical protein